MAPSSRPLEPALSAPDLIGPQSILTEPVSGPSGPRRSKNRPYRHVHFGVDLDTGVIAPAPVPVLRQFESFLREQEVKEGDNLWSLSAATLHAFSGAGFQTVEAWETDPGGTLPLPGRHRGRRPEPVGHLLRALEDGQWKDRAGARSFTARLSDHGGCVADVTVRRVHRQRRHSIGVDLNGEFMPAKLKRLIGALRERLPVRRTEVTKYAYA